MKRTPVVILGLLVIAVALISLSGCLLGELANNCVPPAVGITASPTGGPAPLEVTFIGEVLVGSNATSWRWNYDDGSAGEGKTAINVFQIPGTYTVILTAIVDDITITNAQTIEVYEPEPIECPTKIIDISYRVSGKCCMNYNFEAFFSGPAPSEYKWTFGDGLMPESSALANPPHRYVYNNVIVTVTLTVADKNGIWSDPYSINIPINGCCQDSCYTCPEPDPCDNDCIEIDDPCSDCPLKPYEKIVIKLDIDYGCGDCDSPCSPCGCYITWHVYHNYSPANEEDYDLEFLNDGQCRRNKAEASFYKVGQWKVITILRDAAGGELDQASRVYDVVNY